MEDWKLPDSKGLLSSHPGLEGLRISVHTMKKGSLLNEKTDQKREELPAENVENVEYERATAWTYDARPSLPQFRLNNRKPLVGA